MNQPQHTEHTRPPQRRAVAALERLSAQRGGSQIVLRAFLGATFTFAGLQKLANPNFFNARDPGSFQEQLHGAILTSPIHSLLSVVMHIATPTAVIIACGEVLVGIATLTGMLGRLAATGGMLLSLSFFLTISYTTSPYYYGSDIVFLFAWTPIIIGGSGLFSLDEYLAQRHQLATNAAARSGQPLERRFVLANLGAAGALTAFTGAVVGFVAGLGRALAPTAGASVSHKANPTTTTTGPAALTATPGRKIGSASSVPVGGARAFTDPIQKIPAFVVRPKEATYLAFSAICTHAGCTVGFNKSREEFVCPCHGSVYNALTGEVLHGPAVRPLPPIKIREVNGTLYAED